MTSLRTWFVFTLPLVEEHLRDVRSTLSGFLPHKLHLIPPLVLEVMSEDLTAGLAAEDQTSLISVESIHPSPDSISSVFRII